MSRQLREADVLSVNGKTSSLSSKSLKSMTRSATKRTRARTTLTLRGNATPLVDDSDEENDGCVIQEDEQTTDADEDDVIAPSVSSPHKRGHQTGLSISLSNTTIAHNTRKRSWSNCTKEEDDNDFKRPKKLPKTESGNLEDEDSDTGYEGVDLISDSDDDDTERDEEAMIIQSEEYNDDPLRPASSSSSDSWGGFPDNGIAQESDFFTEHFERSNSVERSPIKPTRRVRFVDEVDEMESSCTNTTDLEDNFFPDLFLQQDRLDPRFRAIIEKESDSEGSYWDFGFGDHYIHDPSQEAEGRDNNDGESSGYESMSCALQTSP